MHLSAVSQSLTLYNSVWITMSSHCCTHMHENCTIKVKMTWQFKHRRYPLWHWFCFTVVSSYWQPIKLNITEAVEKSERTPREQREHREPTERHECCLRRRWPLMMLAVSEDDSASKNKATSVVLLHFGFTRQTVSPKMSVRCGWM